VTTVAAKVLQLEGEARSLPDRLTLEEKLDILDGDTYFWCGMDAIRLT
jgi:hypothetical protein